MVQRRGSLLREALVSTAGLLEASRKSMCLQLGSEVILFSSWSFLFFHNLLYGITNICRLFPVTSPIFFFFLYFMSNVDKKNHLKVGNILLHRMPRIRVAEREDLMDVCECIYLLWVLDKQCFFLTVRFCHGNPCMSLRALQTHVNWWPFARLLMRTSVTYVRFCALGLQLITSVTYIFWLGTRPSASHVLSYLILQGRH